MGKTYRVLVDNMTYVNAFVESRVDETSPANDEYYLVISEHSNYKDFQGAAKVYEGMLTAARLYVFDTDLNKFTNHVEAYENVDLSKMQSAAVTVNVSNGYFTVSAGAFPTTESGANNGKSWAIITTQHSITKEVEDEKGVISNQTKVYGGDLLIGRNIDVTAGQAFTPIYFTAKHEIFDRTVWKDNL